MDPVIVREKLESLRRCVARVEDETPHDVAGRLSPVCAGHRPIRTDLALGLQAP